MAESWILILSRLLIKGAGLLLYVASYLSEIQIVLFYLELSFHVLQVLYLLTRSRCRNKEGTRLGIGQGLD